MDEAIPPVDIRDDDSLFRRLARLHINYDGSVNSAAFKIGKEYDQSISVNLARLSTPEATLAGETRPGFRVGVLVTEVPRRLGFIVRNAPTLENPAHSLIEGHNDKFKSREMARATSVLDSPRT